MILAFHASNAQIHKNLILQSTAVGLAWDWDGISFSHLLRFRLSFSSRDEG
jgi:hypothetical protein